VIDDAGGDDDELACMERIECNEERSELGWRNQFGRLFQRLGDAYRKERLV